MQMTLQELLPKNSQKPTVGVEDFLAKLSRSLEKGEGLKIQEELLSLKYSDLLKYENQRYYSSKMLQDCLTTRGGRTLGTILTGMDELGYDVQWQCINSKDYVPQNRYRIFIIANLRGTGRPKVFPFGRTNEKTLIQLIGGSQGNRVYDVGGLSCTLAGEAGGKGAKTGLYLVAQSYGKLIQQEKVACLDANYYKGRDNRGGRTHVLIKEATKKGYDITQEGDSINLAVPESETRRGRIGKGVANTLDTSCNQGVLEGARIRRLTPKECFRLQGFPDKYFERAAKVNSDSQLYRQAGNSVTVTAIYEIARRLT